MLTPEIQESIEKAREESLQERAFSFAQIMDRHLESIKKDAHALIEPLLRSGKDEGIASIFALIILACNQHPYNHEMVRAEVERLKDLKK